jgi:regulator of sigma E protease
MGILIFVLVLVVLILVHEFGHFVVAKLAKMRVDEFGIGYPPRAWGIKRGETLYSVNWLPFGGFVKIHGEDDSAADPAGTDVSRSFVSKPRIVQAAVLVAGIAMNLALAYVLLSLTLFMGMPRALTAEEARSAPDAMLVISEVREGSPAEQAGLMRGDVVREVTDGEEAFMGADGDAFTAFIAGAGGKELTLLVERAGAPLEISAMPQAGAIPSDPTRAALGVGIAPVGTVSVPWWRAPIDGAVLTWEATKQTAVGLVAFFGGLFTLTADLSQVSGPVGIAGAVGSASETGIVALLTLTALISINLALINLLPVPALDGGRLLFVIIEAVRRKPIPQGVAGAMNAIGFILLILLMLVVTASDIFKLFA